MPEILIKSVDAGNRLDMWLSKHVPACSRAKWQSLIKDSHVRVDGRVVKTRYILRGHEVLYYDIPATEPSELTPEDKPLDILYEDQDIVVIHKPPYLVVHPAPGHPSGTLVHALLFHCRDLTSMNGTLRPGIVHRLDKDTSGVLAVAKNENAMHNLARQFKSRKVQKIYLALVWGRPTPPHGNIETPIGRDRHDRKKMRAAFSGGRYAISHYTTLEQFDDATLLQVKIQTGRTHQIRVHLSHKGHPVVGDTQYGRAPKSGWSRTVPRQMLHAQHLTFTHPRTGEVITFTAPIPEDMRNLIQTLQTRS